MDTFWRLVCVATAAFGAYRFWRGWVDGEVHTLRNGRFDWGAARWPSYPRVYADRQADRAGYLLNMWMLGGCSVFFLFVAWLEA